MNPRNTLIELATLVAAGDDKAEARGISVPRRRKAADAPAQPTS